MKKYNRFFVFVSIAVILILSACGPQGEAYSNSNLNQIKRMGLMDEHPITTVTELVTEQSSFSGSFFILAGAIEGQSSTTVNLKFRWSPKPGVWKFSIVEQTKFTAIIDETREDPVIVFDFDRYWLDQCYTPGESMVCQPIADGDLDNYNDFVQSEHLQNIYVYINSEDRANEPALP